MYVVQVNGVVCDREIDALNASRLAMPPRQVVLRVIQDRQPAEHDIAEEVPAQPPCGRHHPAHAEGGTELLGMSRAGRVRADYFLKRHDVRANLRDHLRGPQRKDATVEAAAAVDVIRHDPQVDDHSPVSSMQTPRQLPRFTPRPPDMMSMWP